MKTAVLRELSLGLLIEQGMAMRMVPLTERDGVWAYKACALSRLILRQVEEIWPPTDYVEREILEAFLCDFPAMVTEVGEAGYAGDWADYLPCFASNINDRVVKLKEYVKNPPFVRD